MRATIGSILYPFRRGFETRTPRSAPPGLAGGGGPALTNGTSDRPLGVILTGGMGTRLRPLTHELPKSVVPILTRPLIAYGLELLAGAGLDEVVVVVAGNDHLTGPSAVEHAPEGMRVALATQPDPRGSGDAVLCAGPELDGRRVVVLAVDALLRGDLRSQVDAFAASDVDAWLVLHPTDRPRDMGIALVEGDRVIDLEEKPEHPRSNLALCGVWMLTPTVVERLDRSPFINKKGEVDLSATIAEMQREGSPIGGRRFDGRWLDVGALGALLGTQETLLAEAARGEHRGLQRTEIREPVLIGDSVDVTDCVLGPNVVIGDHAVLRNTALSNALVAPGARLDGFTGDCVVVTPSGDVGHA
jgi:glucose-1-phosphate thymidylyltransferase